MKDFEELYRQYFDDIYRFILSLCKNPHLTEDIVSDTFFKALKNIDSLKNEDSVKAWLLQIAKNSYFTYLAKNNRTIPLDSLREVADESNIEEDLFNKETRKKIHKVLHKLSEPYKEVFYLRVFGNLSFREIADIFTKEESWARQIFHRSKLKIKEEVK